jgi:hypothetical protein
MKRTKLECDIRKCPAYNMWKQAVLKRDVPTYPKIPKNINVHHIKKFRQILMESNVKTLDDALRCSELWDVDNGVCLTKGEHFIISILERYKKPPRGLMQYLKRWMDEKDGEIKQ